ncbi:MAG: protein tyrosine phosphatase II superfamily protein [uncultured bacterium]|nr:MAG: protein tyrosine phosphatase II superfamily protein [uncultured bacterium]OGT16185.1 MAG: hypothetical protein A3B69_00780 [Gammaproteobacteria bacterium RIFCSPHIGHO2_02_FULL_38_33]OGT23482.1 MAG: hypothetical protein A2W47_05690 [Gammaproteobacteria bacterium RIFCSPHIGHO2_12_38_15]OGT69602.1 MAG: hypothetical protein A3I12_03115 [Gammaproteobacteria bacterium RIFCSPLOWO2_02_FULL_38_11]OGT75449.1 MAG: hypothetical protein A3G71_06365 [Gammaproteobacteria bacterium RIFCSPLOWO2_12_FULL_38
MKISWKKSLRFVFLLSLSSVAYADFTYPVLVLDQPNTSTLPIKYRSANTPLPQGSKVVTDGLYTLPMMGSAQFSEKQLATLIEKTHLPSLIIFDLRQEDHGFLNGDAISWYGINNQANKGKTTQQIEQSQFQHLSILQNSKTITLQQITQKSDDGRILAATPLIIPFQTVFAEADLARTYNFGYTRIYVTDKESPASEQVDKFIATIQSLPLGSIAYFHCRAGEGRTTTFMAMLDMMHNARKINFDDIINRQALIGGINLSTLPAANSPDYQSSLDRLNFLKTFYNYAQTNRDNFKTSFTDWSKYQITLKTSIEAKKAAEQQTAEQQQDNNVSSASNPMPTSTPAVKEIPNEMPLPNTSVTMSALESEDNNFA